MEHIQDILGVGIGIPTSSLSGGCPCMHRKDEFTSAVILWDSAMAHSIAKQLSAQPDRRVVHVCGSFHVERFFGIYEMLSHYRASTKAVVLRSIQKRSVTNL